MAQRSWQLADLVVPGAGAAVEAGKLLEDLPVLWEEVDLTERVIPSPKLPHF